MSVLLTVVREPYHQYKVIVKPTWLIGRHWPINGDKVLRKITLKFNKTKNKEPRPQKIHFILTFYIMEGYVCVHAYIYGGDSLLSLLSSCRSHRTEQQMHTDGISFEVCFYTIYCAIKKAGVTQMPIFCRDCG